MKVDGLGRQSYIYATRLRIAIVHLRVHNIHRPELVAGMDEADLNELTMWLAEYRRSNDQ